MKKFTISTLIALCLSGVANAQELRLGSEGAYEPYNYVNDDGELDGFEIKLGNELCKRIGATCTWVKNDWDSIIPNLVAGNYDGIMAGMSITDERKEKINFSQEYLPADPSSYVALKGASADVLKGKVAAQAATIQASYVAESGATSVEFKTPDDTIKAVMNGEVDAVLADRAFLEEQLVTHGDKLAFVGDSVIVGGGIGIGLRKSDEAVLAQLNQAICSMKKDGSLAELVAQYEGLPQGKPADC